jgi:hypothetical protein
VVFHKICKDCFIVFFNSFKVKVWGRGLVGGSFRDWGMLDHEYRTPLWSDPGWCHVVTLILPSMAKFV